MSLRNIETEPGLTLEALAFNADGLIPAVVVDEAKLANGGLEGVRMLAWMNLEALQQTLDTRLVTFWSRSRQELWTKGESSGNVLRLRGVYADCDLDTLLVDAQAVGPSCHNGTDTCFEVSE